MEGRTWNGRDIDHGLLDGAADHLMVVTSLIMRIQRHLGETWKPGDDGPILARVGGANLPIDGGGTGSNN